MREFVGATIITKLQNRRRKPPEGTKQLNNL